MATRKQSILCTHVRPEKVMFVQKKNAVNGREEKAMPRTLVLLTLDPIFHTLNIYFNADMQVYESTI